ncbi:MAG: DUF4921 family protein [Pirellulales bacterium]
MHELRQDPIGGGWIVLAPQRAARPQEFAPAATIADPGDCPFCEGREDITTPESYAVRQAGSQPNGPGWRVRAIPNKFPALAGEGQPVERVQGMYRSLAGVGVHEVIIESPRHLTNLTRLSPAELMEVFSVYRQRLLALRHDRRLAHALIFKNLGALAGASLAHLHSQLIATPVVPSQVAQELDGAKAFFARHGQCVYCRMLDEELADGRRIVWQSEFCVAFCPYASRFPYEMWVLPRKHAPRFEECSNGELAGVASMVWRVVGGLENALDRPAYNYMMHTAPFASSDFSYDHWHLEITPRIANLAGFEWGTGFCINTVPPEEAAARLRECISRDA